MILFLFAMVLYFLPTIIGHNKRGAAGIFLLNFFLGWTVIGWVIALVWACASDVRTPVLVLASHGRFCCLCGRLNPADARFCGACGRPA
jgi:hypothetical protein